jgi:hypothetical protein
MDPDLFCYTGAKSCGSSWCDFQPWSQIGIPVWQNPPDLYIYKFPTIRAVALKWPGFFIGQNGFANLSLGLF